MGRRKKSDVDPNNIVAAAHNTRWDTTQYESSDLANYDGLDEGWTLLISFIRIYPDFLLDLFHSDESDYGEEELIQRIIMRAKARYQYVDITGCRGLTKTSTTFKEELVEGLVWPGTRTSYYGPSYKQTAKIGAQTYHQLEKDYPGLCRNYVIKAEGLDRFEIITPYKTNFSITAMRGDNVHKVVAEEYAQEGFTSFDSEEYKRVVLPAVRLQYMVKGRPDPNYIRFKQHSITSAGRRQNHAYETRCRHYMMMQRGESAFVMDVPFDVVLLSGMRPVAWAENLRNSLTPDEWAREMESRYTGADENPVISDSALTESRCLTVMEEHHCCKDTRNELLPEDVSYIIGYDVSYADGAKNAKCACVVIKCTPQKEWIKRDKFLKQVVWVDDWFPMPAEEQAKKLKSIWNRYCVPGSKAYIAIDAWQYGSSVLQSLMTDLGDGLNPLCIFNHKSYTAFELENALPCIYPIKAGGAGTTDPDAEMIRYAELQFEYHNVQLLTRDYQDGMEAYKNYHNIKDDAADYSIYQPYKKTNELISQIQNLKKVPNSSGVAEKRISQRIQRDSWSALKYALRMAQVLEQNQLLAAIHARNDWTEQIAKYKDDAFKGNVQKSRTGGRLVSERRGGRLA